MPEEKVAIFIDASNLFHACKLFRDGFKVDYIKLREKLAEGRKLIRAYYYGSFDPLNEGQIKFKHFLQYNGFNVETRTLRMRGDKHHEKGVDVALVTEMLSLGFRGIYDVAVLVSGDDDFVCAVDEVKRNGRRIEIAAFNCAIGGELKRSADRFRPLDDIADEIEIIEK
ncbi:MAG: NYN domain-containing protein [Euryarchaeota archaeon]|nr:NYN domain-containing protein [Euryarchaeota archaeon]